MKKDQPGCSCRIVEKPKDRRICRRCDKLIWGPHLKVTIPQNSEDERIRWYHPLCAVPCQESRSAIMAWVNKPAKKAVGVIDVQTRRIGRLAKVLKNADGEEARNKEA